MRTAAMIAGAALILTACSGAADEATTTNPANESTHECVGESADGLEVAQGSSYDLPEGVRAALSSTDMAGDPPTASLDLTNVDEVESEAAQAMTVGDVFDVKGVTYRVNRICQHVIEVQKQ